MRSSSRSTHDFLFNCDRQVCPFCNKVRAYLDWKWYVLISCCNTFNTANRSIPYTVVEVDPLRKKEIKFSSHYKKVPIVVRSPRSVVGWTEFLLFLPQIVNGMQLNDSTQIIQALERIIPQDLVQRRVTDKEQTGDPTGTGKGGNSIWGKVFEDEFHDTLRVGRWSPLYAVRHPVPRSTTVGGFCLWQIVDPTRTSLNSLSLTARLYTSTGRMPSSGSKGFHGLIYTHTPLSE